MDNKEYIEHENINEKSMVQKIQEIIKAYKFDFERVDKEERYKWKAIGHFQRVWDINAPDFVSMLKDAFVEAKNLLASGNYYPYKMLTHFAENNPDQIRSLFKMLYDESISFEERYYKFREAFKAYYKPQNLNHFQDLHAVSVYLSFKYPEKYYIYKFKIFYGFNKRINYSDEKIESKSDIWKYESYCKMCDIILEQVLKDNEIQKISNERLTKKCYSDDAFHLLVMDIAYFGSSFELSTHDERYVWPAFYMEFADKLRTYISDRKSLLRKMEEVYELAKVKNYLIEDEQSLEDIDPFSVFACFNKGIGDKNRTKILSAIKEVFDIDKTVPKSFEGVPVLTNMNSFFFAKKEQRKMSDIDNLWKLFETAISFSENSNEDTKRLMINAYNIVSRQKNISWKITIGLFWIRPYSYVNLDTYGRKEFLEPEFTQPIDFGVKELVIKVPDGKTYLEIIKRCTEVFERHPYLNFVKLSELARKQRLYKYWPSPEEYNPNLTVEDWKKYIIEIELPEHPAPIKMLRAMMELGGEATCKKLAYVYGGHPSTYVGCAVNLGNRVQKHFNLPDCIDGDQKRSFPIPFLGRVVLEDGKENYSYKIRPELQTALEELDLTSVEVNSMQTKIDKNTILYGPPGTGKTYITARYAVAIIENKTLEEISDIPYDEIIKKYNEYKSQGRIEFTTFHQSYGYEEFIEGIKPVLETSEDENNDIKYEVASGVFKRFCDTAGQPVVKGKDIDVGLNKNPTVWKVSLWSTGDNPIRTECMENGHIRIGWDSYGPDITSETDFSESGGRNVLNSFIYKMKVGDIVLSCYSSTTIDAVGVVTGEYEWNGEYDDLNRVRKVNWLVKGINEDIVDMNNGSVMTLASVYKLNVSVADALSIVEKHNGYVEEYETEKQNYVFIIDEINRGNISKIFGELITLIEPSKRVGQKEAIKVKLPYSQKLFGVPDNVYIIGTMNTADRSIAAIDTALRRRFAFREMMPDSDVIKRIEVDGVSVSKLLDIMNKRIEVLYDREHTIGHAYFTRLLDNPDSEILFDIFRNKIFPLLQEYFYEDYEKIRLVFGDNQKSDPGLQFISEKAVDFGKLFGSNSFDYDDKKTYRINEDAFNDINSYAEMLNGVS